MAVPPRCITPSPSPSIAPTPRRAAPAHRVLSDNVDGHGSLYWVTSDSSAERRQGKAAGRPTSVVLKRGEGRPERRGFIALAPGLVHVGESCDGGREVVRRRSRRGFEVVPRVEQDALGFGIACERRE